MDRLSLVTSLQFVSLLRIAMSECGVSAYQLYLDSGLNKATVYRWLSGKVRIPSSGARRLLRALLREPNPPSLQQASQLLVNGKTNLRESVRLRVMAELRTRGLPQRRTLEALCAAGVPDFAD